MAQLRSYKELIVWQRSIELVKATFVLTETFPKSELYGITSQMRRAAVSIPSNIAEGYGRKSSKEYAQALSIAYGSALELETQLIIAQKLGFATGENYTNTIQILEEVLKMLNRLQVKIKSLSPRP